MSVTLLWHVEYVQLHSLISELFSTPFAHWAATYEALQTFKKGRFQEKSTVWTNLLRLEQMKMLQSNKMIWNIGVSHSTQKREKK